MNEWDKSEFKKNVESILSNIVDENSFNRSMGKKEPKVNFSDKFVTKLVDMYSASEYESLVKQQDYEMRVYNAVNKSISDNKEIVIYTTIDLLDDYMDRSGKLSPDMYWAIHNDEYSISYSEFLKTTWPNIVNSSLNSWDDIMIYVDGKSIILLTILTDLYCKNEYLSALKHNKNETEFLLSEGPYKSQTEIFNDIVVKPKKYNTISLDDISRACRWFIKHRLLVQDKYSIRYATYEECNSCKSIFASNVHNILKDMGIERPESEPIDPKKLFDAYNIEYYYGKYIAIDV